MYKERLDSLFVRRKIASYRTVRNLLANHEVTVNGARVFSCGCPVRAGVDSIALDGRELEIPADIYLMMNKPRGFECSHVRHAYNTVFSLVDESLLHPEWLGTLHTVGRLDVDTEGLLLLTTDGAFSRRLTMPKYHVQKTYHVWLRDDVDEAERSRYAECCARGIYLEADWNAPAAQTAPAQLRWLGKAAECELVLDEGKFHEVKRIFRALGNSVTALRRLSLGGLPLDPSLQPGQYRPLDGGELDRLVGASAVHTNAPCGQIR